jgi:hypothetical protein
MQWLAGSWFLAALLVAGCEASATPAENPGPGTDQIKVGKLTWQVTGPYVHQKLTVFLLHAASKDRRDYLTLDEGLGKGLVQVTEQAQEQVGQLQIDNRSDRPLFLQEGDRLQGGKQDRTITTSLVVPPRSGPQPLPTCCIEQNRWTEGSKGKAFAAPQNQALAPKEVRFAAKTAPAPQAQSAVWESVRKNKGDAQAALSAPNTDSSLNETMDSPQVKKISDGYTRALGGILGGHPGAVGVVIAMRGNIEEVNIYANPMLLTKLYPRLLRSYAFQAALDKDTARVVQPVSAAQVQKFLADGKERFMYAQPVDAHNRLQVRDLGNKVHCLTSYDGKVVHAQWLSRSDADRGSMGAGMIRQTGMLGGVPPTFEGGVPQARVNPVQTQTPVSGVNAANSAPPPQVHNTNEMNPPCQAPQMPPSRPIAVQPANPQQR